MRIDTSFLALASACLLAGICLGIYMGVREDFLLAPVHGHINLVGWVSLALFAVIYRSYPELAASRLALVHFCLAVVSAPLLPLGIYFTLVYHNPALVIAASLGWLGGTVVFFIGVLRIAISKSKSAVPPEENEDPERFRDLF